MIPSPYHRDAELKADLRRRLSPEAWRIVQRLSAIVSESVDAEQTVKTDRCILALMRELPRIAASIERTASQALRFDYVLALITEMTATDDEFVNLDDDPEYLSLLVSIDQSLSPDLSANVRAYVLNGEDIAFSGAADRLDRYLLSLIAQHPRDAAQIARVADQVIGFNPSASAAYFARQERLNVA